MSTDNAGSKGKAYLNQNHTRFVFVENETKNKKFGTEIEFRTELECKIAQKDTDNEIPIILIVINGGENTLETVKTTLEKKIPILVVEVNYKRSDEL